MTAQDYLYIFRKCSSMVSLEKLSEKFTYELSQEALLCMRKAAEHRSAELRCGQLLNLVAEKSKEIE